MPMPGLVPYVIIGSSFDASRSRSCGRSSRPRRSAAARQRRRPRPRRRPCGANSRPARYSNVVVVGRDHAGARAGLDRHVADGHALLHVERADRRAGVLDDVAGAAADADLGDQRQDDVLGGHAAAQRALDADLEASWACAAAGTAWRARARPRWCRCRTRARRTRRGSRCGCRRTRSSCPAA